jgi:hypothetical protein
MPTPNANPLHLYLADSPQAAQHLGQLRITSLEAGQPGPHGLLGFDTNLAGAAGDRWLDLRAEVWSTRTGGRRYGAIDFGHEGVPKLGQRLGSTHWTWRLAQHDLETIEEDRAAAENAPVGFSLEVSGVILLAGQAWRVTGDASFSVSAADWHALLERLEYQVWPTALELDGIALTAHPSWAEARRRLGDARRHFDVGDDEAALAAAFREFERVAAGHPYRETAWQALAIGVVEPKRRDLRDLVAAHVRYLNRLGRHLNPDTDIPGEKGEVGVDHWEAAMLLATSQILLAGALRYGASGKP